MNSDKSATADAGMTFRIMTWNIEGIKRNVLNLHHFVKIHEPDIIFLSEPQIYGCDIDPVMEYFRGSFCYSLNSADQYDSSILLDKSRAHGGTMVMWKSELDLFIEAYHVDTTSFLPIIVQPPGIKPSIHICGIFTNSWPRETIY